MSIRIYVGNLPKDLEKEELESVFSEFGESVSTKLVTDRKTGKSRGFAFVTVNSDEMANDLIEKFNGFQLKESALKIEKALPRSKGKGDEASGSSNTSPANSNRRNNKKSKRSGDVEATQPDPRWAAALAELKDRLAAQATNP